MLVYGKNSCYEILRNVDNLKNVKKIYLERNFRDKNLISLIENLKMVPHFYTKLELDRLADGNHQGIILDIGEFQYSDLDELTLEDGLIVMLDHLEDTHNFGAIIRTCEAAGVKGIIIPRDRSVKVNSTVMKTSSGSATRMKICMVTNLNQTIRYLQDKGYWFYATDMQGEDYTEVSYADRSCIIIGNEGNGVSDLVKHSSDYIVTIPMYGKINSLNASVALGILVYEVVRQKKHR